MAEHVFITYRGVPRPIVRRSGLRRAAGWTRAGTVTSIAAGSECCWDIEGDLDAVHVYIDPGALRDLAHEHSLRYVGCRERTAQGDAAGSRLLLMLASAADERSADRLSTGEIADRLAMHLLRAHCGDANTGLMPLRGGLSAAKFRRTREFMDAHLASDIAIADVAAQAGLSVFHFCRAFKQTSGVSPYQWRQLRRIERAADLLRDTALSVTDIAARVGYDDPSQLSRLFRIHAGVRPRDVRRSTDMVAVRNAISPEFPD